MINNLYLNWQLCHKKINLYSNLLHELLNTFQISISNFSSKDKAFRKYIPMDQATPFSIYHMNHCLLSSAGIAKVLPRKNHQISHNITNGKKKQARNPSRSKITANSSNPSNNRSSSLNSFRDRDSDGKPVQLVIKYQNARDGQRGILYVFFISNYR